MFRWTIGILVLVFVSGCAHTPSNQAVENPDPLEQLAGWMTGSFSSEKQSKLDEDYRNIRLHMIRIWNERPDGYWIYIEQAVAGLPPYRQRIYHLSQIGSNLFQSAVYTFDQPENYAGAWSEPERFSQISPDELDLRTGCDILMRQHDNGKFYGSSVGRECESSLHDASYAMAEVEIGPDGMKTWDRGFNDRGEQVWGAEKGGYIFNKLENYLLK